MYNYGYSIINSKSETDDRHTLHSFRTKIELTKEEEQNEIDNLSKLYPRLPKENLIIVKY